MAGTSKFIQISTLTTPNSYVVLYALDDVGNVWKLVDHSGHEEWILMKNKRGS